MATLVINQMDGGDRTRHIVVIDQCKVEAITSNDGDIDTASLKQPVTLHPLTKKPLQKPSKSNTSRIPSNRVSFD